MLIENGIAYVDPRSRRDDRVPHAQARVRDGLEQSIGLVLAKNVLESIQLLAATSRLLADRCVDGITAEEEHARTLAESSPSIVTPLNRYIGYEAAAAVVKRAVKERKTIREVVIEDGHVSDGRLTEAQLDEALDVLAMTRPPSA